MRKYSMFPQQGFSLVELSIVLVILGLLTGGILAGQSLIRASELRAASSEYSRYITAVQSFRDKYFQLPGDFSAATKFWNRQNTNADCVSNHGLAVAGSPGTCDGNNNAQIAFAGAGQSAEVYQFWRHLALAGLIEGSYTGLAGAAAMNDSSLGVNTPPSKLSQGGWMAYTYATMSGDGAFFNGDIGSSLLFGALSPSGPPVLALVKPEEMWNIDTKMDDGMPARGKIVPRSRINCAVAADGSALTAAAADAAKLDSTYNLTYGSAACAFVFRQSF